MVVVVGEEDKKRRRSNEEKGKGRRAEVLHRRKILPPANQKSAERNDLSPNLQRLRTSKCDSPSKPPFLC